MRDKNSKEMINLIHLYSGKSIEEVESVFRTLLIGLVMDYLDDSDSYLPYIGNISVEYKGDCVIDGGKEAVLSIKIKPCDLLKSLIGQVEDYRVSIDSYSDIITYLIDNIKTLLESKRNG